MLVRCYWHKDYIRTLPIVDCDLTGNVSLYYFVCACLVVFLTLCLILKNKLCSVPVYSAIT